MVAKVYILLSLTLFSCQQQSKKEKLVTDNFKYSAYLWHMSSDTPIFYLAHYLDIDKYGHYSLMRHDTFMDAPKYFAGSIPDSLIKSINEVLAKDNYATDYSIKPEDSFIYDGFTYCIDYKKKDSLSRKIQFIPNKSPDPIKKISLMLDKLIFAMTIDKTNKFDTDQYSKVLSNFSLHVSGPLPKLERARVFIKKKGIVKIVKDCCTAEDSLEPKPPIVNK